MLLTLKTFNSYKKLLLVNTLLTIYINNLQLNEQEPIIDSIDRFKLELILNVDELPEPLRDFTDILNVFIVKKVPILSGVYHIIEVVERV